MTEVPLEAYEGVEDGILSEDNFRDFAFGNPVRFRAAGDPSFFKGTAVASQVRKFLAEESHASGACSVAWHFVRGILRGVILRSEATKNLAGLGKRDSSPPPRSGSA